MEQATGKNIFGALGSIKLLFRFFAVSIFIFVLGIIFYGLFQIYVPLSSGQAQTIEIVKGQGVKEIAQNLEGQKLIRSSFWFQFYAWLDGKQAKLQAGQYLVNASQNTAQIVEMITQGQIISYEVWVTMPEGFTLKQLKSRLLGAGLNIAQDLEKETVGNFKSRYQFLADVPANMNLEGFLFPDTYKFKKEASAPEIIGKMLDNFDKKLSAQMRADIANQNRTIFEIIRMASLLEKEVKTAQDRKLVAGIFWKRIKDNYPLESDATLTYIFDDKKDSHSLEETKVDSPYNTYKYVGLPPTPINNPGIDAIEAAIYPQESDYYFFLTKPDTGEAVFAKTLEEHNLNKAKYLK